MIVVLLIICFLLFLIAIELNLIAQNQVSIANILREVAKEKDDK